MITTTIISIKHYLNHQQNHYRCHYKATLTPSWPMRSSPTTKIYIRNREHYAHAYRQTWFERSSTSFHSPSPSRGTDQHLAELHGVPIERWSPGGRGNTGPITGGSGSHGTPMTAAEFTLVDAGE